jgi:hypothetical protein
MNDKPKPSAAADAQPKPPLLPAKSTMVRLKLDSLTYDPAFTPRLVTAKSHVHDLARALRNCGDLDPIKVWAEPQTGKLIILDGRHRVAAYRFQKVGTVPAMIFQGSRKDARLEAARDNSKTTFPWTTSECTQYAWGLVIEGEASKSQIVRASTVSIGTITNMRKRLADITAAGNEPCGNWWRDRNGNGPDGTPEDDSDEAKQARIKKLREWLHGTEVRFKLEYGRRFTPEELGTAVRWHLGQARFKLMASGGCLIDEDPFSDNPEQQPLEHPQMQLKVIGSEDF